MTTALPDTWTADEEQFDDVLGIIAEVCRRAADGDLEARIPALGDGPAGEARTAINRLLDVTDAFVRDSSASLAAAADGRFHRRFLNGGMAGAFRRGAQGLNDAGTTMKHAAAQVSAAAQARTALADELETAVLGVSNQVASAASTMAASAQRVADFAQQAVGESEQALGTVTALRSASGEIRKATELINRIALQTQLVALNATIEAARAGRAGRGFGVVAREVKTLADDATRAGETVVDQVTAVQDATAGIIGVLDGVTGRIHEMDRLVAGIAEAVRGREDDGLSGLAELLRNEVSRFVHDIRHG